MPTSADLFELFFMGPGLICVLGLLAWVVSLLWKAARRRRAMRGLSPAQRLRVQAEAALQGGHVDESLTLARKAVRVAEKDPGTPPVVLAQAHFALGRAAARKDDEVMAAEQFRLALPLSEGDTYLRPFVHTNLSLVLRRQGQPAEALALAVEAVRLQSAIWDYPDPAFRAGAGWAYAALALARTDSGADGREDAREAVAVFRSLIRAGAIVARSEGLAASCYAVGYAMRAQADPAAIDFAAESVELFTRLDNATPSLHKSRLAEARKLLAEMKRG